MLNLFIYSSLGQFWTFYSTLFHFVLLELLLFLALDLFNNKHENI